MATPSVFGEIPGYPSGSTFKSRDEVRLAGLHRHRQAGISGDYLEGADAIIVSGGYVDDQDHGDRLVYTGQGGQKGKRQVRDQELTKGNLGLARAEELGRPVRVIRGAGGDKAHSPKRGYRYDGLFTVASHWSENSKDGPLIWRFVLEAADGGRTWDPGVRDGKTPRSRRGKRARPKGTTKPGRAGSVAQRIVRNSAVTQWVKDIHEGACQICGITLETAAGTYSEGAHIRALGAPHEGPDTTENVLCLCPNDHVLFDKGALYLDDGNVYRTDGRELIAQLRVSVDHEIDWSYAAYHREHFAQVP